MTRSDSLHETIYLESKWGKRHAIWTLFDDTKVKAKKENKKPVLGIFRTGSHGCLLVIHSNDIKEVLRELESMEEEVEQLPEVPDRSNGNEARPVQGERPRRRTIHRRGPRAERGRDR